MRIPPDIPAYAYIKRELKTKIESGELPVGARVPSEFELAALYKVSRNPTRQALRDLELEGYITRTPGRGSFVAPVSQRQKLFKMSGWRTAAIACPEIECHYTRTVVQGFIQYAAEHGFHTMVYFLRFSNDSEFDFLADIRNSGIEGVALWLQHSSKRTLDLLARFQKSNYPFVLLDRYVRSLESDFVVSNNEDMAYRLTKALIDRGHRRVGMVTATLDNSAAEDRYAGFRRALKEAGIAFTKDLVGVFEPDREPVAAVVNRLMALRSRPTGFFCSNDGAALKLIEELAALGYTLPKDVELATVDDNRLAAALDVPIISAAQAGEEMGRQSAEVLIARIADPHLPPQQRFLDATLSMGDDSSFEEAGSGAGA
jgi:GntR family transcriptional regulator of arabinose operon